MLSTPFQDDGQRDGIKKKRHPEEGAAQEHVSQTSPYRRSTKSFLISAIALAGFRFFGQVLVQFRIVWQR